MARSLEETSQFKRDKKRINGSGRHDWAQMRNVVRELMNGRTLDPKYRDHELLGSMRACASATLARTGFSSMTRTGRYRAVRSSSSALGRTASSSSG